MKIAFVKSAVAFFELLGFALCMAVIVIIATDNGESVLTTVKQWPWWLIPIAVVSVALVLALYIFFASGKLNWKSKQTPIRSNRYTKSMG